MNIQNTNQLTSGHVKALVYGMSGSGKTSSFGTLPTGTLVISAEGGLMPLIGKSVDFIDIARADDGAVLTDPAQRIARLSEIFKWLHAGCPDAKGKATNAYRNVCLDSLTEISQLLVQKLNKDFPDRKDSFPMWGEYTKIMLSIVKSFRDLPYNVFMSVLAEPDKDETGKRFIGMDVAGSMSRKLGQYFDLVLYVHVDAEGTRSFITRSTDTIQCKDRSGKLDAKEAPDLGALVLKIMGPGAPGGDKK
jgi:hypothetical protein